jgi:transaldolase
MVSLALRMMPLIKGFVHVQANPFDAYSASRTCTAAQRLISHFETLSPGADTSRVCIKIPSTWEGLQACRKLESSGVATLATTLFTIEQAAVAGHAQCHYVAPYVHDLRAQTQVEYLLQTTGNADGADTVVASTILHPYSSCA